jgi:hypothetical protein
MRRCPQSGSTTTYSIACPSGNDVDDCGVDGAMTAIEGPHTAIFNIIDIENEYERTKYTTYCIELADHWFS